MVEAKRRNAGHVVYPAGRFSHTERAHLPSPYILVLPQRKRGVYNDDVFAGRYGTSIVVFDKRVVVGGKHFKE